MKITSQPLTMLDTTDSRKLEVYITSSNPTAQIYNPNSGEYTPDWSVNNLKLSATVYLDSTNITDKVSSTDTKKKLTLKWYKQAINSATEDEIATDKVETTVSNNVLTEANHAITYICRATYQGLTALSKVTFSRIDTGADGKDGADGTSVNIKGTATSVTKVQNTDYYTITYSGSALTLAEEGDAYVYNGDLYVCVGVQADNGTDYFINVGRIQGPAGKDGANAKVLLLNGTSQVFKFGANSTIPLPSSVTVTAQRINIPTTTALTWYYNGSTTAPAGVSRNGDVVTITGSTLTTNSLTIKVTDSSVEDIFTVYKAFDGINGSNGSDGQSASMSFLTNENVTFAANSNGDITTTSIETRVVAYNGTQKITPELLKNADGSYAISNLPTGMSYTVGNVVDNQIPIVFTITNNASTGYVSKDNGSITIPVVITNDGVKSTIYLSLTWSRVKSGAKGEPGDSGSDAYTVMLTNEVHTFAGDVNHAYASNVTTKVYGYKGATEQSVRIVSVNDRVAQEKDTDYETGIAGLKFKCSELSGESPTITFTCTESFTAASGAIPIKVKVDNIEFTRMFNYSIAFKGATGGTGSQGPQGQAATSYWLVSSASAVQKTSTGTIAVTPSTLTFTGKAQTGTNVPVDYDCRWVIDYSTNGTSYTNLYTSTTYKTIRVRMYMKDSTTALLDEQIIPVVSDGAKGSAGVNAVSFQVYSQNGYLLTKDLGSLTLQTFAYEGSASITSGATYQWSQFVDNTWTNISGATSTTYTVTQSDVLKSKSYRCVMTYKSQTYTSTVTVQDKTDTYNSIMCISSNATSNDCYWVLYTLVYNDEEEVDPLLGPISVTAPTSPVSGNYWYAVDTANAKVTLKKYNGTSWVDSTDTQSLSYYWDMINDGSTQVPLGASSKVKVVTCNDFTATATLVCEVSNVADGLLTQSSLSITDASDPIVSTTEPKTTVNGQIWIKPNDNGTYLMFVWDASLNNWISSDMDTRNKVYTSRPASYNAGDLWITSSDTDHGTYLHGTLLQAQKSNTSYSASDWSPTLRYDKDIDSMKETLNNLSQYVTITSEGLRIGARNSSGQLSPFTSLFTSTELSFYQNSEKLLTLANNQLTAPRIVVEDDLAVQGSISLGNLKIIIESNGSFSFAVQK